MNLMSQSPEDRCRASIARELNDLRVTWRRTTPRGWWQCVAVYPTKDCDRHSAVLRSQAPTGARVLRGARREPPACSPSSRWLAPCEIADPSQLAHRMPHDAANRVDSPSRRRLMALPTPLRLPPH